MNEGLNPNVIEEDGGEFSAKWWRDTKVMVERGFRRFCHKRGMRLDSGGMREQISGDAKVGMTIARRRKEGRNDCD